MRHRTATADPAPRHLPAARARRRRRAFCALLAPLLALGPALPAAAMELDWQVSLSGAVKLSEIRFGQAQGWTCSTGSQTQDAANGTCTGTAEGAFSWVPGPSDMAPPPSLGFIVQPSFAIHLPDSPTGIAGAPLDVSCGVPAMLRPPAGAGAVDWMDGGADRFADLEVQGTQRSSYCSGLQLQSDGGNSWTLTYSGPATSEGVMQD